MPLWPGKTKDNGTATKPAKADSKKDPVRQTTIDEGPGRRVRTEAAAYRRSSEATAGQCTAAENASVA